MTECLSICTGGGPILIYQYKFHLARIDGIIRVIFREKLRLFNEVDDKRGFHPHVTIAFRDIKKPLFPVLKEKFISEKINGTFNYQGFTLLKLSDKWEEAHFFENKKPFKQHY